MRSMKKMTAVILAAAPAHPDGAFALRRGVDGFHLVFSSPFAVWNIEMLTENWRHVFLLAPRFEPEPQARQHRFSGPSYIIIR